ncbi:23S rRNA (uracil(1939)-C(5))-methyltransferase RlmD [Mycoplasmatota bacterium WC44]
MELNVKGLDINGYGIGYLKKKIVFVKGALPDELVDVEIVKEHKNYIDANLNRIIKRSPLRVRPKCDIYHKCGGCSIMHLKYEEQLKYKRDKVSEALRKYANINPFVSETIGMDNPYNYRNKVQFVVKRVKGKAVMGLYEEGSHFVVDLDDCLVQDKGINILIKKIKAILNKSNIDISQRGLKNIAIRTNSENEMQVVLVINRKMNISQIVEEISNIDNVTGVFENINSNSSGPILSNTTNKLYGKARMIKKLGDQSYFLRPQDFFQLNDIQTKKLYDIIKSLVGDSKRIVDCYAGVGSIGQYIYNGQQLRGIEIIGSAVESAKDNCRVNKIDAEYVKGNVGNVLKRWTKDGYRPDLMIFDPPRTGLDAESIKTIQIVKPNRIIYVSCNPSTLAKDLNHLLKLYKVELVQPVDMFPNTAHVETVVRLDRKR